MNFAKKLGPYTIIIEPKGHHTLLTRQHCCWKLLLATMFPRYFASKFVAKLPAVVPFRIMNNNDLTWKNHATPTNYNYYRVELYKYSRDEPDSPWTQYITNGAISRARYTITHFKRHHHVLRLISNRMSV